MHRFFIYPEQIKQEWFQFEDPKVIKYMRNVLRLKPGDEIVLFDGEGLEHTAVITKLIKERATGKITKTVELKEEWPHLTLAQALPRAGKLDDILRQNTEVGVSEFLLFESEYSMFKLSKFKESKLERLERVVQEAGKQSERKILPLVNEPMTFPEMLETEADIKILLHSREVEGSVNIAKIKAQVAVNTDILVVVGPEGGFSPKEVLEAKEAGFQIGYLNLPILRTETAGVAVSSILLS